MGLPSTTTQTFRAPSRPFSSTLTTSQARLRSPVTKLEEEVPSLGERVLTLAEALCKAGRTLRNVEENAAKGDDEPVLA
jgi:hypothetical protein